MNNEISNNEPDSAPESLPGISKRASGMLLAAIMLVALALQVYGLDHMESEPDDFRLVESTLFMNEGCHPFFGAGYAMAPSWIWSAVLNVGLTVTHAGKMLELAGSGRREDVLPEFERSRRRIFLDPVPIHNQFRWINALAGVGIVFVIYLIAVRLSGSELAGLAGALICATSPLLVENGPKIHPDQFQGLFMALCIYFCLGEVESESTNQRLGASVFCAAAIATKFIAAVFWIPILLAIFLGERERRLKVTIQRMVIATVVLVLAYILINPFFLVYPVHILKTLSVAAILFSGDESAAGGGLGFLLYAQRLITNMGYGAVGLAIVGMVWGLFRRTKGTAVILAAILCYVPVLASNASPYYVENRHLLPFAPVLMALAGVAIGAVAQSAPRRIAIIAVAALVLASQSSVLNTVNILQVRTNGDTRTLARQWIFEHVPAGSRIFVNYYGPYLPYNSESVNRWREFYGNLLVREKGRSFSGEFLREVLDSEERHFFKHFSYLNEAEKLPSPGYDVIRLNYTPEDLIKLTGSDTFWIVASEEFFNPANLEEKTGLAKNLLIEAENRGKLVKIFHRRKMMGRSLKIYHVNSSVP